MNRLKEIREAKGLRREVVAGKADVSLYYLRKLEMGLHSPNLGLARRLADALGVTVDELFPATDPAADLVGPARESA